MMASAKKMLLRGRIVRHASMAPYTSWRTGGVAERLFDPADLEDLKHFMQTLSEQEAVYWLGLGSNLLVRDGGMKGTMILTQNALRKIELLDKCTVRAEAGVPGAKLAKFCAKHGLRGAEFFAGIPGTVGGALAMNAGAFGSETWPLIKAVETIDRQGQMHARTADDYQVAYRSIAGPKDEGFIAAHFSLAEGDADESLEMIKGYLNQRARTQPTQQANAGSVFKNPINDHAARLIEVTGLKGKNRGGARISEMHANFIINEGNALASDIEDLIEEIKAAVKKEHGIQLETEVRIIGERNGQ